MAPTEEAIRGHIPSYGFADGKVTYRAFTCTSHAPRPTHGVLTLRMYVPDVMQVIHDARFRLATALREAGVHRSEAAMRAVQSFHPRPHLAIHGLL